MKRGKKYQEAAKLIERGNLYDKAEAIALVKKLAVAKFDETIEAHIRTGCDGRHADQQIRGAVVLPHGTGKTVRILVFAKDAKLAQEIMRIAEQAVAQKIQQTYQEFLGQGGDPNQFNVQEQVNIEEFIKEFNEMFNS